MMMDPGLNVDCNIMIFRPTLEQFQNFSEYIKYMESRGAHRAGVAKVIPPEGWKAVDTYDMTKIGKLKIETPVAQTVTGHQGLFQLFNVQKKSLTVDEFKELAESQKYKGPASDDSIVERKSYDENVERHYWKNVTFNQPIYGADVPGTIYDPNVKTWNISRLGTILDLLGTSILGVNTPYLYFGMWKTTFPWHTEDMDLYSINYLHFGAPKSWYAISPDQGSRLETLAKGFFSGSFRDCQEFMRHKMSIISPQVLKKFSIPVQKITQYEGEFMITFPRGYHSGYNHGFNCAESTNFASERWIDFGKKAKHCQCKPDSVKIDMDLFVQKFQPDKWNELQQEQGKDATIHKKRKTLRANYSSDSSPLKLKVFTGQNADNTISRSMKVNYIVDEHEEDSDSSSSSSSNSSSDSSDSSDAESSDDEGKLVIDENRFIKDKQKISKFHCNYNSDRHKKEVADKKENNSSRRHLSEIHKKMKDTIDNNKKKEAFPTFVTPPILKDMWSDLPPGKYTERSFNEMVSLTETRCAVCVYLSKSDSELLHKAEPAKHLAEYKSCFQNTQGKLLVTELCFAMDSSEENNIETAFNLMFGTNDKDNELAILTCSDCGVSVHNTCYGSHVYDKSIAWYCDKCKYLRSCYEQVKRTDPENFEKHMARYLESVKCSLCCIVGGALKITTNGEWCHIVCAISIPEVIFLNNKDRGPIDTSALNPARKALSCLYCHRLANSPKGACIQCKCGKCAAAFHVTCNFHHGIPLFLGDWPICIESLCPKHVKFRGVARVEKRSLREVATDALVFAKHKNGRYYRGKIIDIQMILYYKVVFDDKSFCFDLPPDDIQGVDAKTNIIPAGEMVDILWPDSMTYRAEVTGHWYETMCQVRFEDGSILHVKRSDLYVDGEEIPKNIQSKLSYASETKNKLFLPGSLNSDAKRSRIKSWRCKNTNVA